MDGIPCEVQSSQFDLIATLTIKHGGLADAVKKVGSQASLSRALGVSQSTVSQWCRLLECPPRSPNRTWTQSRIDKLESDLLAITGRTLDELFPVELRRQCHKNARPKVFEKRLRVEREALSQLASDFVGRMTLPAPDELLVSDDQSAALGKAMEGVLGSLSYREREIIKLRYGIGSDGYSYTLEETAHIFKVTRERIRQIEAKAIRKLQQPSNSQHLSEFLEGPPTEEFVAPWNRSPLSEYFSTNPEKQPCTGV